MLPARVPGLLSDVFELSHSTGLCYVTIAVNSGKLRPVQRIGGQMAEAISARTYRMIRSETVCLRAETESLTTLDTAVRDGIWAFFRYGLEVAGVLTGS